MKQKLYAKAFLRSLSLMPFMFSQVLLNSNTFYKSLKMRVLHTKNDFIYECERTYEADEVDEKGAFSAFSSSSFNVTLLLCASRGGIFTI